MDASTESATSRSIFPPLSEVSLLQLNGTLTPDGSTYWALENVDEDEPDDDRASTANVVDTVHCTSGRRGN